MHATNVVTSLNLTSSTDVCPCSMNINIPVCKSITSHQIFKMSKMSSICVCYIFQYISPWYERELVHPEEYKYITCSYEII